MARGHISVPFLSLILYCLLGVAACSGTEEPVPGQDSGDSGLPDVGDGNDVERTCSWDEEVCDTDCVDTDVSNDHCGECGNACAPNEVCDGFGDCVCADGYFDCAGECKPIGGVYEICRGECVNTNAHHDHCGSCDSACIADEEVCSEGSCQPDCPSEYPNICDGACFDLQTDDENCGTCGNVCATDIEGAEGVCEAGICVPVCPDENATLCEDEGWCTDIYTDDDNCGECGESCPSTEISEWSECEPLDPDPATPNELCSEDGIQFRTITTYTCEGGECVSEVGEQDQDCTLDTEGLTCGETDFGSWSECEPVDANNVCSEAGERTRWVDTFICKNAMCSFDREYETESCTLDTDGLDCSSPSYGDWSECGGFDGECGQDGERERVVTHYECSGGGCEPSYTEVETETCTRNTEGNSCGDGVTYGDWSDCGGFDDTCDQDGTRSRTVYTHTCGNGQCGYATTTETESCSRITDGITCDTTSNGEYQCGAGSCDTLVCDDDFVEDGGQCVECASDGDCADSVCDTSTNECVECLSDNDCGSGETCYASQCEIDYSCEDLGNSSYVGNNNCFDYSVGEPEDGWHCDEDTEECCPYRTSTLHVDGGGDEGELEEYCRVPNLYVQNADLSGIESTIIKVDGWVDFRTGGWSVNDSNNPLSSFSALESVGSTLEIQNGGISSLNGLDSLETVWGLEVDGDYCFYTVSAGGTCDALPALVEVQGDTLSIDLDGGTMFNDVEAWCNARGFTHGDCAD